MRVMASAVATLAALTLAAAAPPPPDGWMVYPTPKPDACEWARANHSDRYWRVLLDKGRLVIEPANTPRPKTVATPAFDVPPVPDVPQGHVPCDDCVLRVADGWLVGFNRGEWGGGLWWTNAEGKNAKPISRGGRCADIHDAGPPLPPRDDLFRTHQLSNIVSLHGGDTRAFAFAGLFNYGDTGSLSRIERHSGTWQACVVRNLEATPETLIEDAWENWLVLIAARADEPTERPRPGALIRVDSAGQVQRLAEPAFSAKGLLFPNSMVKLADGTLYVGMMHFVARLIPDTRGGYTEELLLPKNRPPFDYDSLLDDPQYKNVMPGCPRLPKPAGPTPVR